MTEVAQRFLRSFTALPQSDQHDVLVILLRLPLDAEYGSPNDDELVSAADEVFLQLEKAEREQ